MDDDILFGAGVWGPQEPASSSQATIPDTSLDDDFDDEFGEAAPTDSAFADEDDFGDFGDFEDAEVAGPTSTVPTTTVFHIAGPSTSAALRLDLNDWPSHEDLVEQVYDILDPIWADDDVLSITTNEGIRDVEGISQILSSREGRDLYNTLTTIPAPIKPPNWTRSRIRRQHLIALGIPVNLDEILPQANGKALPTIHITTRPMSAPPGPRGSPRLPHVTPSAQPSRASTPLSERPGVQSLGERPVLDHDKITKLLDASADDLALLPVKTLEKFAVSVKEETANASALLTWLLQCRDILQQDSETYNGLIAELVGEAQKIKTGKIRNPIRRGTGS